MIPWIVFGVIVTAALAIDLGVFHRKSHAVGVKEALIWSAIWISLSLVFNVGLYLWKGPEFALQFLTGYLIEKSLSVDNIFVFAVLFRTFAVPKEEEHGVLFWGILGALIMRAVMIALGATLIKQFEWVLYVFGAFLIITGIKLAFQKEGDTHPEKNPIVRLFQRWFPLTTRYHGKQFFIQEGGKWVGTPLLLTLVAVEATDLMFAVDSIPAVFAVTRDPFIVYTSNIFAILGLRSLYFALAGMMGSFHYLKYGLSGVLCFVGFKMIITHHYKVPVGIALGVIALILGVSVVASLISSPKPRYNLAEGNSKP